MLVNYAMVVGQWIGDFIQCLQEAHPSRHIARQEVTLL